MSGGPGVQVRVTSAFSQSVEPGQGPVGRQVSMAQYRSVTYRTIEGIAARNTE